jgi:hypothetical protein
MGCTLISEATEAASRGVADQAGSALRNGFTVILA